MLEHYNTAPSKQNKNWKNEDLEYFQPFFLRAFICLFNVQWYYYGRGSKNEFRKQVLGSGIFPYQCLEVLKVSNRRRQVLELTLCESCSHNSISVITQWLTMISPSIKNSFSSFQGTKRVSIQKAGSSLPVFAAISVESQIPGTELRRPLGRCLATHVNHQSSWSQSEWTSLSRSQRRFRWSSHLEEGVHVRGKRQQVS